MHVEVTSSFASSFQPLGGLLAQGFNPILPVSTGFHHVHGSNPLHCNINPMLVLLSVNQRGCKSSHPQMNWSENKGYNYQYLLIFPSQVSYVFLQIIIMTIPQVESNPDCQSSSPTLLIFVCYTRDPLSSLIIPNLRWGGLLHSYFVIHDNQLALSGHHMSQCWCPYHIPP